MVPLLPHSRAGTHTLGQPAYPAALPPVGAGCAAGGGTLGEREAVHA